MLNLYSLRCAQDYTLCIEFRYCKFRCEDQTEDIFVIGKGIYILCCSARETLMCFMWPKQERCLWVVDEAFTHKERIAYHVLSKATKCRRNCQILRNRYKKFQSNKEHVWLLHTLCRTIHKALNYQKQFADFEQNMLSFWHHGISLSKSVGVKTCKMDMSVLGENTRENNGLLFKIWNHQFSFITRNIMVTKFLSLKEKRR